MLDLPHLKTPGMAAAHTEAATHALDRVRAAASDAVAHLTSGPTTGAPTAAGAAAGRPQQVAAAAQLILSAFKDLAKTGVRPSFGDVLAMSRSVGPMLSAWEKQPPALRAKMPADAAMGQIRQIVSGQEMQQQKALLAAYEQLPEGSRAREAVLSNLAKLGESAIAQQARNAAGLANPDTLADSDQLAPPTAWRREAHHHPPALQPGRAAANHALRPIGLTGVQTGGARNGAINRRVRVYGRKITNQDGEWENQDVENDPVVQAAPMGERDSGEQRREEQREAPSGQPAQARGPLPIPPGGGNAPAMRGPLPTPPSEPREGRGPLPDLPPQGPPPRAPLPALPVGATGLQGPGIGGFRRPLPEPPGPPGIGGFRRPLPEPPGPPGIGGFVVPDAAKAMRPLPVPPQQNAPGAGEAPAAKRQRPLPAPPTPGGAGLMPPPNVPPVPINKLRNLGPNARAANAVGGANAAGPVQRVERANGVGAAQRNAQLGANFETIRNGGKVRIEAGAYHQLNLNSTKFSLLQSPSGRTWAMTPTRARGSFGKVRVGLADDGSRVAIKEMRLREKKGVDKSLLAKTRATAADQIINEAKLTVALRSTIERGMAQLPEADLDALRGARTGTTRFQIHDIINVADRKTGEVGNGKVHMVMTKDVGSLWDLGDAIDAQVGTRDDRTIDRLKGQASLSLAAQGFSELALMHQQAGHAHLDISPGNIFFNELGQMRIMDFGMAQPIDASGRAGTSGILGTIFMPEMAQMLPQSGTRPINHTTAQDTFAMGICVAHLCAGAGVKNPFELGNLGLVAGSQQDISTTRNLVAAYQAWRDSCRGPSGRLEAARVMDRGVGAADPYGFGQFFSGLARRDSALCELVLNDALNVDPSQRRPAAEIGQSARDMLPPAGSRKAKGLVDLMAAQDDVNGVTAQLSDAAAWRQWEAETRATRDLPKYGRGVARPLR